MLRHGLLAAASLLAISSACGGEPDDPAAEDACSSDLRVYFDGRITCGDHCPLGSEEAYRDGPYVVCHACSEANIGCLVGETCTMRCGPGCESDTGGCCGVRVCEPS